MITQNNIQTINGAKIIIKTLEDLGVDTIFGYPGGIVLDVYDELYKDSTIKHILTRHEQSAVHAAEGYARQTGKCGVVLVTSGPGATNTVTGVLNAYLDGYPLIVLAGQVCESSMGKDAFQEANICDITKSCTKKTFQITSASDIHNTLIEAYNVAMTGKKGPVVIDFVKDIFKQTCEYKQDLSQNYHYNLLNYVDVSRIVNLIENAQRPLVVAGGGVKHSKAEDELFNFAHSKNIPVVSTMMGLGTYPQYMDNYFGMIGIFGDNSANKLMEVSDLVISLGARFNDRIISRNFLNGKLLQIDINPDEISRVIKSKDFIIGDIKEVLNAINITKVFNDWCIEAQKYKTLNNINTPSSNMLHSFEVINKINEYTFGKDITFTSEVGQHQIWAARNLDLYKNRQIFVSGGLGTMGFGLPAAIGASIATKGKPVVCITGDGSFQMSLHELATCKDYGLNVKIMIFNNGYLGMVRQLQEKFCEGRYTETKILNPDFVTLAKSYGIDAIRVSNRDEVDNALNIAFSTNKTYIIDFVIEPMETL